MISSYIKNLIEELLKSNIKLIGFGELGHGLHDIVFEQFSSLKGLFNGIFLEFPVDYQSSINNYLKNGILDQHIEDLLKGSLTENKDIRNTLLLILDFAKDSNIPVICIDSSKTKTDEYTKGNDRNSSYLKSNSRDEDMYLNILNILNNKNEKWCLICHAAHLDYAFDMNENDPSLGKRLKLVLKDKIFSICLFKTNYPAITYFLSDKLPKELSLPIPSNPKDSFDAVLVH